MNATAQDHWEDQADEPAICIDGKLDVRAHDAYWQSVHWGEPYFRTGLDYEEDYAPAYCVGYIGYAQYGGTFDDAEKSLAANWIRIKGASRLTFDEAMQAIRAAWDHAERGALEAAEDSDDELVTLPTLQRRMPAEAMAAA